MKARAWIAVILAMAVALGAGAAFQWSLWRFRASGREEEASLSPGQLWSLPTYHKDCNKQEDCEPPLSCVADLRINGFRCLGSECQTEADCSAGYTCRLVSGMGPNVRICTSEGTQKEGERCDEIPLKKEEGCESGLICNRHHCGRSCRLDDPASCPQGFTCLDNDDFGPSCLPSCLGKGCPDGGRCIRIKGEFAVCSKVVSETDCEKTPCPAGQECARRVVGFSGNVSMWCRYPCDDKTPCPSGMVCFYTTCRVPCTPGDAGTCGPNEHCLEFRSDDIALCAPKKRTPASSVDGGADGSTG